MRKQYVDFLDYIDGGGAGQTGNSFQGGGLLSALGNIFATPYGSEDQARRAQRRQALGLLDTAAAPAPAQAKVKPGAPFAPRTAPPGMTNPMGTSFGAMGNPVDMSRDEPAMPPLQIPPHLTGPKMGMAQPEMQYPWQGDARFVQIMQQQLFSDPNLKYLHNDPQGMQNVYEVYLKYAQQ